MVIRMSEFIDFRYKTDHGKVVKLTRFADMYHRKVALVYPAHQYRKIAHYLELKTVYDEHFSIEFVKDGESVSFQNISKLSKAVLAGRKQWTRSNFESDQFVLIQQMLEDKLPTIPSVSITSSYAGHIHPSFKFNKIENRLFDTTFIEVWDAVGNVRYEWVDSGDRYWQLQKYVESWSEVDLWNRASVVIDSFNSYSDPVFRQYIYILFAYTVANLFKTYFVERRFGLYPLIVLDGSKGKGKSTLASWFSKLMWSFPAIPDNEMFEGVRGARLMSEGSSVLPLWLDDISLFNPDVVGMLKTMTTSGVYEFHKGTNLGGKKRKFWINPVILSVNALQVTDSAFLSRLITLNFDNIAEFNRDELDLKVNVEDNIRYLGAWLIKRILNLTPDVVKSIYDEANKVEFSSDIRESKKRQFLLFGVRLLKELGIDIELNFDLLDKGSALVTFKDQLIREMTKVLSRWSHRSKTGETFYISSMLNSDVLERIDNGSLDGLSSIGLKLNVSKEGDPRLIANAKFFRQLDCASDLNSFRILKEISRELGIPSKTYKVVSKVESKDGAPDIQTTTMYGIDITELIQDTS